MSNPEMEAEDMSHETATALRSELAALQYKKERLLAEVVWTQLQDARTQLRGRDQRTLELQSECEALREQSARQGAVVASLKRRQHELEERERALAVGQGRAEADAQALQREKRALEERTRELEKKVRCLELECNAEEQQKEGARRQMHDVLRRFAAALGTAPECAESTCPDALVHRTSELVQEAARLRTRAAGTAESLSTTEVELRSCRESLERSANDREALQRQAAQHLLEIDRLRQDKETLELQLRTCEREGAELREKLTATSRSLGAATGSMASQDVALTQLREESRRHEERATRLQAELRRLLEGLAVQVGTPARFVEATEEGVRERIREILQDLRDRSTQADSLRDKANLSTQQLGRALEQSESSSRRLRVLEDEKAALEARLVKLEGDLTTAELSRDALRRDKNVYLTFLERIGRGLHMDEISRDVGVDLHTESLLARAEQLARLETDKIVDKLLLNGYAERLRREKLYSEDSLKETAAVYQLQRRVRTLREQLQRRDLHLDLLRRKITLQEDNGRIRSLLEGERDEANIRVKKMLKQADRLQLQLAESRAQIRDLKSQLADSTEYKISALERGRKVEELEKRLAESELLRTRCSRKVTLLKDTVRTSGQASLEERAQHDHTSALLREELASARQSLAESQRREAQLLTLRATVGKLLGVDPSRSPVPDYDIVSRLQKLVHAQREFAQVSRRYEDPLRLLPNSPPRCATPGACGGTGGCNTGDLMLRTPDSRTALRYDDSGFCDPAELSPLSELDDVYNKRPLGRPST
ncbi:hypothetical protein B566_EDAN006014 [Ephemera danica]|nr:hypothetical protein B566_EDAN006014 [Ephemera danica]